MMRPLVFLAVLSAACPVLAAEPIALRAGPLSMMFEPDHALLRYIRVGPLPVLQGVNAPVRNQYWGTVQPQVHNVRLDADGDAFDLKFDVVCREADIDFIWTGRITGDSSGKLVLTFDGEARSTFLRNRIGFCVLHGPDAAGRPCVIETTGGERIQGHFPSLISPHQPFKNIRSIAHELKPGVWAHVRMEGDTFEMEDQRNWTDASFKTYCTPLELPYPVRVEAGTKIAHRIELSIDGAERVEPLEPDRQRTVVIRVPGDPQPGLAVPPIGLKLSSQAERLSDKERARLRDLHLGHLRVDLAPADKTTGPRLLRARREADELGTTLHAAVHLGDQPEQELKRLAAELDDMRPDVSVWLMISADAESLRLAREYLTPYVAGGWLGTGEDSNFTELNRSRSDPTTVDVVSYGLNPQVHAFDNTSLVETLAIQAETVRTARSFIGDLPLLITPITLRPDRPSQEPPPGQLPPHVDPRQPTLFTAAWTLGSIKYLAEAGVAGLTYFETVGWLGVMAGESGPAIQPPFAARPGTVFPVYHVLRDVGEFAGGRVLRVDSSEPMSAVGLALEKDSRRRLLLANLTAHAQSVRVEGFAGRLQVHRLDARNVEAAIAAPESFGRQAEALDARGEAGFVLELPPYGLARLDRQP